MKLLRHPAPFPPKILEVLRGVVPKGIVLDPFGGVGRLGLLGSDYRVISCELESEWATQGWANGCAEIIIGDSRHLPFEDDSIPTVATSPSYANRMADSYAPDDYGTPEGRRGHQTRRSYRLYLERELSAGSGAALQWGVAYRDLHFAVIVECHRILKAGGRFVLNVKDHVRKGKRQEVPKWWTTALRSVGFRGPDPEIQVPIAGDQNLARMRKQGLAPPDHELVLVFHKEAAPA